MALTVTDQRAILNECDSTTGWTGATGTTTTEPTPVEASACITDTASNATVSCYYTDGTGWDMSAGLLYVWFSHRAALDTYANGGVRIIVGDGTNMIEYDIAGDNKAGFRHETGPAGWISLIIDSENPPTSFTTISGSEASLDWSSIVSVGIGTTTLAKAVGGAVNVFIDIMRFGDTGEGLLIGGGTSSVPGTFAEIAAADSSTGDQQGYGVFREYSSGVYGCQGPLTFGSDGASDGYFSGDAEVLVFEDRDLLDDKYSLTVAGDATYGANFSLSACIIKSAAHGVVCDFSDQYIDSLDIDACTFADLQNAITFSNAATASGHSVTNTTFSGCGQIDPGDVTFTGNTISGTTAGATGALLIDADGTSNISDISFISGGSGHAIYITAPGSYTFTGFTYSGYGATDTTDAVIYNNSGGAVTVTVSGGDTPTYRNGSGASTTIVSGAVTLTVTAVTKTGTPIESARVLLRASDGTGPFPYDETVTISNSGTTATVTHTGHGMATGDYVQITGASLAANNGVFQVTVSDANTYTYTMSSTPGSSPTGTIKATFVALYGLTDVNGEITTTRVYSTSQPVIGWTRKTSASPYYQEGVLTGSVSSTTGYNATAVMISDE